MGKGRRFCALEAAVERNVQALRGESKKRASSIQVESRLPIVLQE